MNRLLLLLQLWPDYGLQELSKLLSVPDSDVGCRCQAVQGLEPLCKPLMLASSWYACRLIFDHSQTLSGLQQTQLLSFLDACNAVLRLSALRH